MIVATSVSNSPSGEVEAAGLGAKVNFSHTLSLRPVWATGVPVSKFKLKYGANIYCYMAGNKNPKLRKCILKKKLKIKGWQYS